MHRRAFDRSHKQGTNESRKSALSVFERRKSIEKTAATFWAAADFNTL
jgi:hypothetical protein